MNNDELMGEMRTLIPKLHEKIRRLEEEKAELVAKLLEQRRYVEELKIRRRCAGLPELPTDDR